LLRETDRPVTEICFDVGFASLGSFGRTFRAIVGLTPSEYRRGGLDFRQVPNCFVKGWSRPSSFGVVRVKEPA
jgi:AraC-like DNA-binding protein